MAKKMLINVMHPEEARVAIVEDGRLVDLDVEIAGSEQTRGNVYKGVVVRVEPGLQAAFVDIGLKKLGFLQVGEIHPSWWQWRDDIPEEQRNRRPRIQEILRRGQELVVQVEKGERDMKGAALTSYLSLPGRYMVLMPGSDSSGISRKVESEADRKKLKEKVAQLEIPEGIGYIVRTEALGKTKTELAKDLQYLLKLSDSINEQAAVTKGPALIYQESNLVIRTIRDYFTAEIDEVLVDSKDVYKQARAFFKETMPKFEKLVKLHQEKRPIFSRYQIEEQIDLIYEKKVPLKSGGSIVIEPTEALVSVDVNSGKSTGEKGVEDTAFKTNLEAAEEVARQLRLRDLGGLIVIDFIDMRDKKHISAVEKTLKTALKTDKARVTVGRISQFGILEMSRQRIRQTLEQGSTLECPHCSGRGKVKSVESMALSFLRKVHAAAAKGTVAEVRGGLPLEVAYYLLNRKKRELAQIENDYDIEVTVKGKPSFLMNQLELELERRERPAHLESAPAKTGEPAEPKAETVEEPIETTPGEEAATTEGTEGKKRKRRRSKKKPRGEEAGEPAASEAAQPLTMEEEEEAAGEAAGEPGGEEALPAEQAAEETRKKRRRKRRRSKKPQAEQSVEAGAAPAEEEPAAEATAEPLPVTESAESGEDVKKKKRRRKRRPTKRGAEEESAGGPEAAVEPPGVEPKPLVAEPEPPVVVTPPVAAEEPPAKKPRAPRTRKKPAPAAAAASAGEPEPAPTTEPAPEMTEAAPKKKRAPRKKATADAAPEPPPAEAAAAEAVEPAPPPAKKPRAPRKKKELPPADGE